MKLHTNCAACLHDLADSQQREEIEAVAPLELIGVRTQCPACSWWLVWRWIDCPDASDIHDCAACTRCGVATKIA